VVFVAGGTILLPVADCFNHSPSNANCEVLQHADAIEVATGAALSRCAKLIPVLYHPGLSKTGGHLQF
jgi:hypothetical protein